MAQQQPVIVIGAISIDGGPPRPCVISGMASQSPPLQIWGGGGVGNYPDAGFPGPQPPYPPKPWGPINYPDIGLPGPQPPYPPRPTHPIYYPPTGIWGGGGVGNYPDAGFPGPQPPGPVYPWAPIFYPDQGLPIPQPPSGGGPGKWQWVYSPLYGWVLDPGLGGKPQPPPTGGEPLEPEPSAA